MSTRPPRDWKKHFLEALLQITYLAHTALMRSHAWALNSPVERIRLRGDNLRLTRDNELLREELAIKDARIARMAKGKAEQYTRIERLRILQLREAWSWTAKEAGDRFGVTAETINNWRNAAREAEQTLLATREPVNKYPDFAVARRIQGPLKLTEPGDLGGLLVGALAAVSMEG
jgi:transposase-like protein